MSLPKTPEIKFVVRRADSKTFIHEEFMEFKHLIQWCSVRADIIAMVFLKAPSDINQYAYLEDNFEKMLSDCGYEFSRVPIVEDIECPHFFEDGTCQECGAEQDFSEMVNRAHEASEGKER